MVEEEDVVDVEVGVAVEAGVGVVAVDRNIINHFYILYKFL